MKRTIWIFGLISGAISSGLMLCTVPFLHQLSGNKGYVIGYTAIVLSLLLVYFGIRSYRDNAAGGKISFGRAFAVGISITLISCVFYVVTWEVVYFKYMKGSMDGYFAKQVEKAKSGGGSEAEIAAKVGQIKKSQAEYESPLYNAAYTFIEPFPVGLVITLVSAGVLRRKAGLEEPEGSATVA